VSHAQSLLAVDSAFDVELGGHLVQEPKPVVDLYVPVGHLVQEPEPVVDLYVPAGHAVHGSPLLP
jgi:hypothetical protein